MSAYDPAGRYLNGTGPAPRTFTVSREMDSVYVCDGCGAVLRYGSFCSACKPRRAAS